MASVRSLHDHAMIRRRPTVISRSGALDRGPDTRADEALHLEVPHLEGTTRRRKRFTPKAEGKSGVPRLILGVAVSFVMVWIFLGREGSTTEVLASHDGGIEFVEDDWKSVCFSSQHEMPDVSIGRAIGLSCWDGREVPGRTTLITYELASGECRTQRIAAYFISEGNHDTRCFSREEARGFSIEVFDGVIHLVGAK